MSFTSSINLLHVGDACPVPETYRDVDAGATVTIRDGKGEVVGMGILGTPKVANRSANDGADSTSYCLAEFTVNEVTRGRKFYSIEISDRGQVPFSEDQIFSGPATMKLGSV